MQHAPQSELNEKERVRISNKKNKNEVRAAGEEIRQLPLL